MAYGDGPAVHVELVHGDAETVAAVDYLHRESFIEFPEIDVFDLQSVALEQFGHSEDWTDAHFVGFTAGDLEAAENHLVGDAPLVGTLTGHEQGGGSSVGQLRGIPCRYRTLSAVGIEVGLEREQCFERGLGAIAL